MNYSLNNPEHGGTKELSAAFKKFLPLISDEKAYLAISFIAILLNAGLNLVAPLVIGRAIDTYIVGKDFHGVLVSAGILLVIYVGAFIASFVQIRVMGGVAQRMLYKLRNAIFVKLQELPVAFFNQNKAGDLISRINNDTNKLNQFFSQALMQFVRSAFMILGAGISVLLINPRLGAAAILPAIGLLIVTQVLSPWIKRKNATNLQAVGGMSANIQESLTNFGVIVAFNRREYFRERFSAVNDLNYSTSVGAGLANNVFTPVYGFSSNMAILIVIAYGLHLISVGALTIGLLISFLTYVNNFYDPLRQIASIWSTFQLALAAWDRIAAILSLDSNMAIVPNDVTGTSNAVLEFQKVHFNYPDGKEVLHNINFALQKGKTYAFVGPTGGGKTTTASLMARLYDPTEGTVLLGGKDIRSYTDAERSQKVGFILQEPFLFTGTVRENIIYGNDEYEGHSAEQLTKVMADAGLDTLLARFTDGLETPVEANGAAISLGQRQLIAFIRAALRKPDLLILDEATANIDTITEQLLEEILTKLPKETTMVVIAHRLNTIETADEIFFVNSGEITRAGSLADAVQMLMEGKRES